MVYLNMIKDILKIDKVNQFTIDDEKEFEKVDEENKK